MYQSMLAEDVVPSRLEKSKQIVSQIINQLE
jgi:Ca-activated chloride channel family protein